MPLTREQRVAVLLKAARFEEILPPGSTDEQRAEAVEQLASVIAVHPSLEAGDVSALRFRAAEILHDSGPCDSVGLANEATTRASTLRLQYERTDAKVSGTDDLEQASPERLASAIVDELKSRKRKKPRDTDNGESAIDFTAEVEVTDANPPVIRFTVDRKRFDCGPGDLSSAHNFSQKFFSALYRYPKVPDTHKGWKALVNTWMAGATHVSLPDDCSPAVLLRLQIVKCVRSLSFGESVEDLDRGVALLHDERTVFKTSTLFDAVRTTERDLTVVELGRALRDLGFDPKVVRFGAKTARVWVTPEDVQPPPESSPTEEEEL